LRATCSRAVDIADLKHLILQNDLLASQEPDVARILPSGWRSITIVVFSEVASRILPRTDPGGRDYGVYVSCGWRIVHDCSRIVTTRVATNGIIAGENRTDDDENCNDDGDDPPSHRVGSVAYHTVIRVIHCLISAV
jgi:hypothetical protein